MTDPTIKERFKQVRKAEGLTQQEMGDILGVNQSMVAKVEKGTLELSGNMMVKLYQNLGVSPLYLLTGQDKVKTVPDSTNVVTYISQLRYELDMLKIKVQELENTIKASNK